MAAFYLMRATPLGCAGVRECILTTNAASGRRGVWHLARLVSPPRTGRVSDTSAGALARDHAAW